MYLFYFSLIIFFVGVLFLGLGAFSFRWRAVTNKKAWNGKTRQFFTIGIIIFIISLALIYLTYPN